MPAWQAVTSFPVPQCWPLKVSSDLVIRILQVLQHMDDSWSAKGMMNSGNPFCLLNIWGILVLGMRHLAFLTTDDTASLILLWFPYVKKLFIWKTDRQTDIQRYLPSTVQLPMLRAQSALPTWQGCTIGVHCLPTPRAYDGRTPELIWDVGFRSGVLICGKCLSQSFFNLWWAIQYWLPSGLLPQGHLN